MSFDWSTTDLPNPSIDYSGQIATSVIRTKMESGRYRQRRRYTSAFRTIMVQWLLTDAEFKLFQGVFKHKLSAGADAFDNLTLALGDSLEQIDGVRFTDEGYTFVYVAHMNWRVRAKIEVPDISQISEAEVDALLA